MVLLDFVLIVILLCWLTGFTLLHVGSLIHLLLVVAVIVLVVRLLTGRRVL